jgi:hypothetical protein
MMNSLRFKAVWGNPKMRWATFGVLTGLLLNYILEHHSFLPLGVLSPRLYLGGWLDSLLLPTVAFFLASTGIILFLVALARRSIHGNLLRDLFLAVLISIPLTGLYGVFYFGMQFLQSGSDVLGECSGLDQAAANSGDIPDSVSTPGRPSVGCAVERYGMFLSFYNDLIVHGVTNRTAQDRILGNLVKYRRQVSTHPVRVGFYESENWTPRHVDSTGKGWGGGERGPEKLIRIVTLR